MTRSKKASPFVNTLRKILDNYVVRNVLILFLIGIFIYWGALVFLRHYTHHGEVLPVPDVSGLTVAEAGKTLLDKKMRWQVVDSVYVTSVKPGAVVNQNPEPGFKVKEKRNVFLTINALAPEKVKMPDVVGVSLRQAKTMLESQGLTVGKMTYVPDIAQNNVLKQIYKEKEITKGTEIVKGSEIDLVLGLGLSDERTIIPDLLGLTLTDARDNLTKYSLNFGVMIYDDSVVTGADSVNAFVFRQKPEAVPDATLQLGSAIDVWLTIDETKKPEIVSEEKTE